MHPLNFCDYGGERKKSFHSQKEKEGVLLHHFHVLNLVLMVFSLLLSPALKPTYRHSLPLNRKYCGIVLLFKMSFNFCHVSPLMSTPHFRIERL